MSIDAEQVAADAVEELADDFGLSDDEIRALIEEAITNRALYG